MYKRQVFTGRGTSRDVVYFSQYDPRWGGLMYGQTNTIAGAGCGPTSLAICVSTLTDTTVTPPEVCDWSVKTGHRCEGSGSYHSLIPDGAAHYNVPCRGIGPVSYTHLDVYKRQPLSHSPMPRAVCTALK